MSRTKKGNMSDAELERLAHADYWDEQYRTVEAGEQFHEWFRSFEDLAPWLEGNLLQRQGGGTRVLHLGSGDSASGDPIFRPFHSS